MKSIAAVIFDFDGLMVDTEWPAFAAWSEIYREHGVQLALEQWVACVGTCGGFDPCAHLRDLLQRDVDAVVLTAEKERRKSIVCDQLPLMRGVLTKIAQARQLKLQLGVASSSSAQWVHGHLQRLQAFSLFDAVVTRQDVARVKPHPDLYWRAAQQLAVEPADCLVFEDSLNGVMAAKAAGMHCVAVPNRVTSLLDFSLADAQLQHLDEKTLIELLPKF